jgi:hypothetical protein
MIAVHYLVLIRMKNDGREICRGSKNRRHIAPLPFASIADHVTSAPARKGGAVPFAYARAQRGAACCQARAASSLMTAAERPVACFGDFQPFDFEQLVANHALSGRGSVSDANQRCQLVGRESVHMHGCFGAASRTATEQRKRAALIGLWASRWSGARHRVVLNACGAW